MDTWVFVVILIVMVISKNFAAVVLVCLGVYFFFFWDSFGPDRTLVKTAIKYPAESCSEDFPLLIGFKNETDSTIFRTSFSVTGFHDDFSAAVFKTDESYSSDKVLDSGDISASCWKIPPAENGASSISVDPEYLKDVRWSVNIDDMKFTYPINWRIRKAFGLKPDTVRPVFWEW